MKETIEENQKKFTYRTSKAWGDLDDASNILETRDYEMFSRNPIEMNQLVDDNILSNDKKHYEEYDIEIDIQHFKNIKQIKAFNRLYHFVKQPHILENTSFYNMRRQLNREQAVIVKDILTKKKGHQMNQSTYF